MTTAPSMDRTMTTDNPMDRPTATLSITLAQYTGLHLRYCLRIVRADGTLAAHAWYGTRRQAARAGREWARANGHVIQGEDRP